MVILGLNVYHGDSSACLVIDGKLICAIEEERIRRVKHWAGFPAESLKWCLRYAGIDVKDIDFVAISRNPSAHIYKKILKVLTMTPKFGVMKSRLRNVARIIDIKARIAGTLGVDPSSIRARVQNIEHHRAHIGSSFLVSPFEEAVCISVDGFGDFVSVMRGKGTNNGIDISDWVEFPHSLGIFYTAFTQALGFWKYGDEYKVMGLSALGEPAYVDKMKSMVRLKENGFFDLDTSYFLHDKEGVDMLWEDREPFVERLFSDKLTKVFGEPREKNEEITEHHQNLASSMQAMYEEAFFHLLNRSYEKYRINKLALSGGCIQNSLANGKIFQRTPFNEVYISPASYDAGGAIGAAFWVWNCLLGNRREFIMTHPYWGPEFSSGEVEDVLKKGRIGYVRVDGDGLLRKVAEDIANGKIVGWFQGRTEWGPRALGNRSILVDARRGEMKDILNKRIKRRETFRPFAPSVLEEHSSEWFEETYPVPFMEKVYKIRPEKRALIPAVTHVDGTGRLQTVSKSLNSRYHALIEEFYRLTGIPVVLNTSFNENEPIVNTSADAVNCFLRTKMDVLVVNDFYCKAQDAG